MTTRKITPQTANALDVLESALASGRGRYINAFVGLSCAPDLLEAKLFPNAKEITESFAAYQAVRDHLPAFDPGDDDVVVICVGDGSTPRTAATFAFRSRWDTYSIDPALKGEYRQVKRLTVVPHKVENVRLDVEVGRALLVAVHSHAPIDACLKSIKTASGRIAVVAMPCCVDLVVQGQAPDVEYDDPGVWSPKRTVRVWRDVALLTAKAPEAGPDPGPALMALREVAQRHAPTPPKAAQPATPAPPSPARVDPATDGDPLDVMRRFFGLPPAGADRLPKPWFPRLPPPVSLAARLGGVRR